MCLDIGGTTQISRFGLTAEGERDLPGDRLESLDFLNVDGNRLQSNSVILNASVGVLFFLSYSKAFS